MLKLIVIGKSLFNESVISSGLEDELYKRKFLNLIPKIEQFNLQRPIENKSFLKRNGFKTTNSQVFESIEDLYEFMDTFEYPLTLRIESEEFIVENEGKLFHILKGFRAKSMFHQIVVDGVFDNVSSEIIFALKGHILDSFGIISAMIKETGEFNGFIDIKFSGDMIISFSFLSARYTFEKFLNDNFKILTSCLNEI